MSLRVGLTTAAVVAAFAALGAAGSASASTLSYQGLSFQPVATASGASFSASDALWGSAAGPVRRRAPRDRYHRSSSQPRTFASIGFGAYDPSDQPGSGLYVNGTVGAEMPSSPVDLGLIVSWYHRSTGGSEYVTSFEDPAGNTVRTVIQTDEIKTDLVPLLAFVRVRFPMGQGIEPYVGAGAGWEWLSVEGVDSDGFAFSDDYDGFGAQFFGGMNLTVSPNTALYGEVMYNKSTVSADFYDPFYGVTVRDEIDMDGAAIHGGLRFRF